MFSSHKLRAMLILTSLLFLSHACDDNKNDNKNGSNGNNGSNMPSSGGPNDCQGGCCGPDCNKDDGVSPALSATADLQGAFGLLVVDQEEGAALALMEEHNETANKLGLAADKFETDRQGLGLSEAGEYKIGNRNFEFPHVKKKGFGLTEDSSAVSVQKVDKITGEVLPAISQNIPESTNNNQNNNQKLPKVLTIALSPTKDVYLHFERPFQHKDAPRNIDWGNQSNGYQCQIFKVGEGTLDDLLTAEPTKDNLKCIDSTHFIDQWRSFNNGVFQFDDVGNIYYPGQIPNTGKMVVYRLSQDLSTSTEMINANICVNDFLITGVGGVFYTGQTCQSNSGGGGGGGFFRYVAPGTNSQIIEIARDWWNFIYDTSVEESTAGKTDTAVFFGPDPRNANTASWDSACLFHFDPSEDDPESRISNVITCGSDIQGWLEMRRTYDTNTFGEGFNNYTGTDRSNFSPTTAWKKEFKRRCETKDEVFAGGGSQISAIQQDSEGKIYVIGNIRKKAEGALTCNVEFRGPHCVVDNVPALHDTNDIDYTKTSCGSDGGTWVNKGRCSDGSTDADACTTKTRTWTPGYCTHNDYLTKATCEAANVCKDTNGAIRTEILDQTSCTNQSGSWGTHNVWKTGRCSIDDWKIFTQTACEAASHRWDVDTWNGSCTSTDATDNATVHNNNKNACLTNWQTENVWYESAKGDICTSTETGDRSTWYNWDSKDNNFASTADSTHRVYADLTGKFLVKNFNCAQVGSAAGGNNGNNWTTEYAALARVNASKSSLELISLASEKAIKLWIVNDKPYYSSFDTALGKYLLNGLVEDKTQCVDTSKTKSTCSGGTLTWSERACIDSSFTTKTACEDGGHLWQTIYPYTVLSDFETYNLSESADPTCIADSGSANCLMSAGLDFVKNQYKFGTVNLLTPFADRGLDLAKGLTGTVKTIIILPHK